MKKLLSAICILTLSLGLCAHALAVTLTVASPFAGTDPAADTFAALIMAWEEDTGNTINDISAPSDEAWKAQILSAFTRNSEPDVLFYFANTADSKPILDYVVPIAEINEAYPGLSLIENPILRESDGNVYAIPVRSFWEGLFVNTDLFGQVGAALPTDWAKLEDAIAKFNEAGIVPIAASLSDIPHYIVEFTILASGTPADHQATPKTVDEMPESWVGGMELIHKLYELDAFPADVNATSEAITSQLFKNKQAAMQLDGSWFANGIAPENWDTTITMPFPTASGAADPTATVGGPSMGFYMTKKAWNDPEKREVAVDFLRMITSDEAVEKLGFLFGGELLKSAKTMVSSAQALVAPIGDTMDIEARNLWFSMVPGIADGTEDARAVMEAVIEHGAYK